MQRGMRMEEREGGRKEICLVVFDLMLLFVMTTLCYLGIKHGTFHGMSKTNAIRMFELALIIVWPANMFPCYGLLNKPDDTDSQSLMLLFVFVNVALALFVAVVWIDSTL
jgi:hypothetical protein